MRAQFLGGLVAATLAVAVGACTNPLVIAAIDKAVVKKGNRLDPAEGIAGQPINLIMYQDPGQEWAEGQSATEQVWWGDNSSPSSVTFDGPGFTKSISHTYSKPGTYSVDIFQDFIVMTDKGAKLRKLLPIESLVATINLAPATPTPAPTTPAATTTPVPVPAGATPTPSVTPTASATPTAAPSPTPTAPSTPVPLPSPTGTPLANPGQLAYNVGRTAIVVSGFNNVMITAIGSANRDAAAADVITGKAGLVMLLYPSLAVSTASGSAVVSGTVTLNLLSGTNQQVIGIVENGSLLAVVNQQASGSNGVSINGAKGPNAETILSVNGGIGQIP